MLRLETTTGPTKVRWENTGWGKEMIMEKGFAGADPGFYLGGGAPLRNDVTDRTVNKF